MSYWLRNVYLFHLSITIILISELRSFCVANTRRFKYAPNFTVSYLSFRECLLWRSLSYSAIELFYHHLHPSGKSVILDWRLRNGWVGSYLHLAIFMKEMWKRWRVIFYFFSKLDNPWIGRTVSRDRAIICAI